MFGLILLFMYISNLYAQETALLVGGFNGAESARDKAELLNSACSIPSLLVSEGTGRSGRSDNVAFLTGDNLILTCGGESADGTDDLSCQYLDTVGETWLPHSMLDTDRVAATVAVLPDYGSYILGGFKHNTSSFLPTGSSEWIEGPTLSGDEDVVSYYCVCGVVISRSILMVIGGGTGDFIGGTRVQTYDAETDEMENWPELTVFRYGQACAKIGDKVIIAGGWDQFLTTLTSTTVLDLVTRESSEAGDMLVQRAFFGMANIDGSIFLFGGLGDGTSTSDSSKGSLEMWNEEEEMWYPTDESMPTTMNGFGMLIVNVTDVCLLNNHNILY